MPKQNIREIIISVARDSFATEGFNSISMNDIRQKVSENLGKACNIYYYFPSKDELYLEIWQQVFEKYVLIHEGMFDNHLTMEEQLRKYIAFRLSNLGGNTFYRIWYGLLFQEFNQPTPHQHFILEKYFYPVRDFIARFIDEILGEDAKPHYHLYLVVELCVMAPVLRLLEFQLFKDKAPETNDESFYSKDLSTTDFLVENQKSREFVDMMVLFLVSGIKSLCQNYAVHPNNEKRMSDILPDYDLKTFLEERKKDLNFVWQGKD